MIRGGALAEPVREVTIASTMQRLLLDIVAVGGDLEWLPGGTGGVTLVIRDVRRWAAREPRAAIPTWPNARRRAGCASTSTRTRCGRATARPRPTSSRRPSSTPASTSSASPTTHDQRRGGARATAARAASSSARSCAPAPARSSGCSSPSACRSASATSKRRERIRDQGGLVYVPHPFDPTRHCLREDALARAARRRPRRRARGLQRQDVAGVAERTRRRRRRTRTDLPGGAAATRTCPRRSAPRTSRCRLRRSLGHAVGDARGARRRPPLGRASPRGDRASSPRRRRSDACRSSTPSSWASPRASRSSSRSRSSGHLRLVPWLFGWDDFAGRRHAASRPSTSRCTSARSWATSRTSARPDLAARVDGRSRALQPTRESTDGSAGVAAAAVGDPRRASRAQLLEDTFAKLADTEWLIGVMLIVFGLVLLWADRLAGTAARWRTTSARDARHHRRGAGRSRSCPVSRARASR